MAGSGLHRTWHRVSAALAEALRDTADADEQPALPLVVSGALRGRLGRGRLTVGRAPDCDYLLSDPTASRHHAKLRLDGGQWIVMDLRSRNGVYVNGRRVWRAALEPGDRLLLGQTLLEFVPSTALHPGATQLTQRPQPRATFA